jgi:Spy/CpxP family protein refolding chaperone
MQKKLFIPLLLIVLTLGVVSLFYAKQHQSNHHSSHADSSIHNYFHQQLHLTKNQEEKLSDVEKEYAQQKQRLEEVMRLANMELADAIKKDHSFSPEARIAVDKIHKAMGELQKASLEHLFKMGVVLDESQKEKLNQLIVDALYENAKM